MAIRFGLTGAKSDLLRSVAWLPVVTKQMITTREREIPSPMSEGGEYDCVDA